MLFSEFGYSVPMVWFSFPFSHMLFTVFQGSMGWCFITSGKILAITYFSIILSHSLAS